MKFGLSDSELEFLQKNLIHPLKAQKARVFIFGSRATQSNHKFSDIDVLFIEDELQPIDPAVISNLLIFFEDSYFPYKIDLVNDKNLVPSYRQNVEASMVEV